MILVACAAVFCAFLARRERFRVVCLEHRAVADRLVAASPGRGAGSPEFYRELRLANGAAVQARAFDGLMAVCVLIPCAVAGVSVGRSIHGLSPISRGLVHESR
jgi:hypothetical protein